MEAKASSQCAQLLKVIMNNKNAGPFNVPVDYVQLGIPDYPRIIKTPMDFSTVQKRLSSGHYESVDEWIAEMRLVFNNATTFNPPDHVVHQMAKALNAVFDKKLATLLEKIDTRGLVDVHPGGGSQPSSDWQRKCKGILKSTMDHLQAFPFNEAVDWKKLKIPDYPQIIKRPMDLGTVEKRLNANHYHGIDDFAREVRLTFTNAKTYNVEFSDIHQMAKVVEAHFEDKLGAAFKGKNKRSAPPEAKGPVSKRAKAADSEDELSDVSHELPEEPTEEEKTRPVALEEKRDLNEKINLLKSDELGKMVDIVKDRCPKSIDQTKDDEIEIDVDALEPGDLRYVAKFVNMCANPSL